MLHKKVHNCFYRYSSCNYMNRMAIFQAEFLLIYRGIHRTDSFIVNGADLDYSKK